MCVSLPFSPFPVYSVMINILALTEKKLFSSYKRKIMIKAKKKRKGNPQDDYDHIEKKKKHE